MRDLLPLILLALMQKKRPRNTRKAQLKGHDRSTEVWNLKFQDRSRTRKTSKTPLALVTFPE